MNISLSHSALLVHQNPQYYEPLLSFSLCLMNIIEPSNVSYFVVECIV